MKARFGGALAVLAFSAAIVALLFLPASDAEGGVEVTVTYVDGTWTITPVGAGVSVSDDRLNITGSDVTDVNVKISGCRGESLEINENAEKEITLNVALDNGYGDLYVSDAHNLKFNLAAADTDMRLSLTGVGKTLTFRIMENVRLGSLTTSSYSSVEIASSGDGRHVLACTSDYPLNIKENSDVFIHNISIVDEKMGNGTGTISIEGAYNVYIFDANVSAWKINIYASINFKLGKNDKDRSYDGDTSLSANEIEMTMGISSYVGSEVGKGKCRIFGNNIDMSCALTESLSFENVDIKPYGDGEKSVLYIHNDTIRLPTLNMFLTGDHFNAGSVTVRSINSINVSDGCFVHLAGDMELNKLTTMSVFGTIVAEGSVSIRDVSEKASFDINANTEVATALMASSVLFERCPNMMITLRSQGTGVGIVTVSGDIRATNSYIGMKVSVGVGEPVLMSASGTIYLDSAPEGDIKFFVHSASDPDLFEPAESFKSGSTARIEGLEMNISTFSESSLDAMVIAMIVTIAVVVVTLTVITEILIRKK